jgi:hypothetical protein
MGFERASIQFLLKLKQQGIPFDRVLTVGRQGLHIGANDLHRLLTENGIALSRGEVEELILEQKGYCEPLLKLMGAGRVDSMDISDYEGASILHDMNMPLPATLRGKFSLVIDGGSLEHVFQYPTALKNCMEAVAVGGYFVTITPANNLMGHGFYQLSPELFFQTLHPDNGFKLKHVIIYEYPWKNTWYEVNDPAKVRSRVQLKNKKHAYLIAFAKRTAVVPIFAKIPQQSDYSALWQASQGKASTATDAISKPSVVSQLKRHAPRWVRSFANLYWGLRPFRARFYRKFDASMMEKLGID